jgi:predicted DNA-binding transcriptional regulator AlpA
MGATLKESEARGVAMNSRVDVFNERRDFMTTSALDVILDEFVERVAERVARRLESRQPRPDGELLSVPEAAAMLRCKPQRVYDLRSAGRLPRTVEGGRAVVRRADLERLIGETSG